MLLVHRYAEETYPLGFTGVTNVHVPLPQPTAWKPPTCSLMTATGSNLLSFDGVMSAQIPCIDFHIHQMTLGR